MTTNGEGDIDVVDFGPNIHVSAHPIIYHKISILRSSATKAGTFRSVLRELTHHLGYEATKGLKTRTIPVSVNVGKHGKSDKNNGTTTMTSTSDNGEIHKDCTGHKISTRVALIPILRSGLGMADGFLELLPKAAVHHIGMYHIPGSAPVQYFNRLPRKCESEVAFVVDPVIGSGETIMAVIAILKKVRRINSSTSFVCMFMFACLASIVVRCLLVLFLAFFLVRFTFDIGKKKNVSTFCFKRLNS